ncbi:histidine phosphatase superfamily [Xylariaceae sp. FL1019]|nr:histidine phosphatase superfamily [Xylariaceae sp. FL1019]
MAPIIDVVRHGEARHNVERNGRNVHDPMLTVKGIRQCFALQNSYPHMDGVAYLISSPMRRTIYTAVHAFEPLLETGKPIHLVPELQEFGDSPANTGSCRSKLVAEFGSRIDASLLEREDWSMNSVAETDFSGPAWAKRTHADRAREARLYIRDLARRCGEDDHIVIITHCGLARTMIEGFPILKNTELIACSFADLHGDDNQAKLVPL